MMKRYVLLAFLMVAPGRYMKQARAQPAGNETATFVAGFWGVRYQIKDVARAVAFYTHHLGFKLDQQNLPAFGQVSIGNLKLVLSGPGASGSRPMPSSGRAPRS